MQLTIRPYWSLRRTCTRILLPSTVLVSHSRLSLPCGCAGFPKCASSGASTPAIRTESVSFLRSAMRQNYCLLDLRDSPFGAVGTFLSFSGPRQKGPGVWYSLNPSPSPTLVTSAESEIVSLPSDDADNRALLVEQARGHAISVAYPLPALAEPECAERQRGPAKRGEDGDCRRVQVLEPRDRLGGFTNGRDGIRPALPPASTCLVHDESGGHWWSRWGRAEKARTSRQVSTRAAGERR